MHGHTVVELLLVLTLLGATGASLAPTARRYLDRASVVSAREALVGLVAETRLAAVEAGEARVSITVAPSRALVLVRDSIVRGVDFGSEYDVTLELRTGRAEAELVFGASGLGRMAAQTIRLRRGASVAEVIVSGYGRVRRR